MPTFPPVDEQLAYIKKGSAEIVKESVATGKSIIEIARERKQLTEEEIAEILDPVRMTEPQYPLEAAKERDKAVTA